jgi:hypothetical protein
MISVSTLTLLLAAGNGCEPAFLSEQPAAVQQAFCEWSQTPDTSTVAAVSLAQIYARPQFSYARAPSDEGIDSLWQQLEAWLAAQLDTQGAARFSQSTRVVVLLVGVLAVLLLFRRKMRPATHELALAGPSATLLPAPQGQAWPQQLAHAHQLLLQSPRLAMYQGSVALLRCLQAATWLPEGAFTFREATLCLRALEIEHPSIADCAALLEKVDPLFYSLQQIDVAQGAEFLQSIDNATGRLKSPS